MIDIINTNTRTTHDSVLLRYVTSNRSGITAIHQGDVVFDKISINREVFNNFIALNDESVEYKDFSDEDMKKLNELI